MPDIPNFTDHEVLIDYFGEATAARGLTYADQDRVQFMQYSQGGEVLSAVCRGSGRQAYRVHGRFEVVEDYAELVFTDCSCPVGAMCKHGAALMVAAARRQHGNASRSTGLAPVTALPTPWRTTLAELVTPGPPLPTPGDRPVAIQIELPEPTRYAPNPEPLLRLVTTGKRGTWVRSGISWQAVLGTGGSGFAADRFDADQLRAIRAVVRAVAGGRGYIIRDEISLAGAQADIWDLLDAARMAGIEFVAGRSLDVDEVTLMEVGGALSVRVAADGDGGLTLTPFIEVDGEAMEPTAVDLIGQGLPHGIFVLTEERLYLGRFLAPPTRAVLEALVALNELRIPAAEVDEFTADYLPALEHNVGVDIEPGAIVPPEIEGPLPELTVTVTADGAWASWRIGYMINGRTRRFGPETRAELTHYRDADAEVAAWRAARAAVEAVADAYGVDLIDRIHELTPVEVAVLIGEVLPELRADPRLTVVVEGHTPDYRPAAAAPVLELHADAEPTSNDWFNLKVTVEVDGHTVPLAEVLVELARGSSHMLLGDGTYFSLQHPEIERMAELMAEAEQIGELDNSGNARGRSHNVTLWDEVLTLGTLDHQLEQWHSRLRSLSTAEPPTPVAVPGGLHADLRDYQQRGLDWLAFLWDNGLGGILADDMGLGKTVQTLALLAHIGADRDGPFLVVAPTSVVGNWESECEKFVPDMTTVAITATEARAGRSVAEQIGDADIVVTSYTLLRLMSEKFGEYRWAAVILDEAQFVKNHTAKTHQVVRGLNAAFTLAITGTPMENNLMELWSLLSLTAPGLFPSAKVFTDYFRKPIESGTEPERLAVLRRRMRPFMLRRTKDQVAGDLPPKQEQVLSLALAPKHDRLYQTRLSRERQKVLGLLGDWERNRFEIFRSLTMLRQLSLHAGLVDEAHAALPSAKIDHLAEQLPELISEGHSALVFSQFTGFLALVRERLDAMGITYSYLDGSMNSDQRSAAVADFRSGGNRVFLISLKAGGFGLNLTEADYCFVCDPWWNPAAEAQAVDRAHRLGQTRPVTVYRLVSAGTIEENVVALQERKRELFTAVVDDGDMFGTAITANDIRELLGGPGSSA